MTTTINLNDLLKNFELKNTIPENTFVKETPKDTDTHKTVGLLCIKEQSPNAQRPFQSICNDIVRAFSDPNIEEGNKRLTQLKRELLRGKKGKKEINFSLTGMSDVDLKELYKTEKKRIDASQRLANVCVATVDQVQSDVRSVREKTTRLLSEKETLVDTKRVSWNKKADKISKKHLKIVSNNHKIIEKDWNKMLKQNEVLESLQGGGSALHRLEMAQELGGTPSETCIGRAKIYDKSKAIHETVHWRLRDVVDNVTQEYIDRIQKENETNLTRITAKTIADAKESIRKATSDYYIEDSPLKYEVEMLRRVLKEKGVSSQAVTQSIIENLQYVEGKNRHRLGAIL